MFIKGTLIVEQVTNNRPPYLALKEVKEDDIVHFAFSTDPDYTKRRCYVKVYEQSKTSDECILVGELDMKYDQFCQRFADIEQYRQLSDREKSKVDFIVSCV